MTTNNDHYSIGLETLANRFDSAILSIGVVQFDPASGKLGAEFYAEIEIDSAIRSGFVNGSTLAWWMRQGDKARRIFDDDEASRARKKPLATALDEMASWFRSKPAEPKVWGNGSSFDITILEHAYAKGGHGLKAPWHFTNIRDMRTIVELAALQEWPKREGVHHNALDDARYQARVISACWQKLKGAKPLGPKTTSASKPAAVVEDDEL